MCALRALDLAGIETKSVHWAQLSVELQTQLMRLGSCEQVDRCALRTLLSNMGREANNDGPEPDSQHTPAGLSEALGPRRPMSASSWAILSSLERYSLWKLLADGHYQELACAYDEIVGASGVSSHLSAQGEARMVNVSLKPVTERRALASARVRMSASTLSQLADGKASKGDVIAISRIAGIMSVKRTSDLIPLCHPVATTKASVDILVDWQLPGLVVSCEVCAVDRTGVEMEAMTGATVAALTVYDMLKGIDRAIVIETVQLELKEGGRSGRWTRQSTT
jgi:cyclic pyranopterin phosphate synthase